MSLEKYEKLNCENLDLKLKGSFTTVANNDLARLMYYLSCVSSVIQIDINEKLIDFKNYDTLSKEEEQSVVVLASLFDPQIFINHQLFLVGRQFVMDASNQFYELSHNKFGLLITSDIIIGGISRKVLQLMGCTESWLINNYYNPLDFYKGNRQPVLPPEPEKEQNCFDSSCNCMVICFDSCCCCECTSRQKKICCFVFLGFLLFSFVLGIISSIAGSKN